MKSGSPGVLSYFHWIAENLAKGSVVAADSKLIGVGPYNERRKFFEEKGIEYNLHNENLVDLVWGEE